MRPIWKDLNSSPSCKICNENYALLKDKCNISFENFDIKVIELVYHRETRAIVESLSKY